MPEPATNRDTFDLASVRRDFALFDARPDEPRQVFLDSGASSQKPLQVIDRMSDFAKYEYANIHRGSYELSMVTSREYEAARAAVARFIGAPRPEEVIFTKNATESLNLVAGTWGRKNLGPGDVVVLSQLEHHSNVVPWFQLQEERNVEIRWIPYLDGALDLTDLDTLLIGAKLVAITAMSNVVGTLTPVRAIADAAHAVGALVCVDACQFVPHLATDVVDMGADFLAFSGHKMLGPSGIGVLWGRTELLEAMPPFLGGGGMITTVDLTGFKPKGIPDKFEAGTPPIIEAVGLHAAIEYLEALGMDAVRAHEVDLTEYALRVLPERVGERLTIHGVPDANQRGAVLSIALDRIHSHDLSEELDKRRVCVRSGHHCAKPLMLALGLGGTARASFYVYNGRDDVDALADALVESLDAAMSL